MQTKVSRKGQVVLPGRIHNKLGLRPGDPLDASVEGGRIVLTPGQKRSRIGIWRDWRTRTRAFLPLWIQKFPRFLDPCRQVNLPDSECEPNLGSLQGD